MDLINDLAWVLIALLIGLAAVTLVLYFAPRNLTLRFAKSISRAYDWKREAPVSNSAPSPEPARTATPSPAEGPLPDDAVERIKERVLKGDYESVYIGGAVLLVQSMPGVPEEEVALIFRQVRDTTALVNVAFRGDVRIEWVKLITVNPNPRERKFAVGLALTNQTDHDVTITIPKGQVFENKRRMLRKQNLAVADKYKRIIPARRGADDPPVEITLDALCINKGFALPDGGPGNITIFELSNNRFVGQSDLWYWIGETLDTLPSNVPLHRSLSPGRPLRSH